MGALSSTPIHGLATDKPISRGLATYCSHRGFSLIELCVVVALVLVALATTVPLMMTTIGYIHLEQAAIAYAGLLQRTRLQAVQDNRYYAVYVQTAGGMQMAYADVNPKLPDGTSGHGSPANGGFYDAGPPNDPMVQLSTEANIQPEAVAPSTAALHTNFCSSCVAAGTPMLNTAPVWGPDGLPCQPKPSIGGVGTVCNAAGGPVAYITYLQSTANQAWQAVTLAPAGRVQVWTYSGGTWSTH
jgi:prepilin-type N-terminal cleavage/methylation domain-containing protein